MSTYYSKLLSNLPSYENLNDVIQLDTTNYADGTEVIVTAQGIFTWHATGSNVPAGTFVYPATTGFGWTQDATPAIIVGDDGLLDISCLPAYLPYKPVIFHALYNAIPASLTISITAPGVKKGDLVFVQRIIDNSPLPNQLAALYTLDNEVIIGFLGPSAAAVSYAIIVIPQ